jgi:hypothetical protein
MPRSKSKPANVVSADILYAAGWVNDGDNWFAPDDINTERPVSYEDAVRSHLDATTGTSQAQTRRKPVRVSPIVQATVRRICQYLSTGATQQRVWGDQEVSLKRVVSAVTLAFEQYNAANTPAIQCDKRMITNAVNALKRNGEIESTKKGWFRPASGANVDWAQFIVP